MQRGSHPQCMHFVVHPLSCRQIFPISSLCSGVINEKLEKEVGLVDELEIKGWT